MRISKKAEAILTQSGWHPGRRIDVDAIRAIYRDAGFVLSGLAERFLSEFGDLSITYPHFRAPGALDGAKFRPVEACAWQPEWLRSYEQLVRKELIPIGYAFSDHMVLLMASDGSVYGCFEDTVVKVGESGIDAINALCEGREPIAIDHNTSSVECQDVRSEGLSEQDCIDRLAAAGWTPGRDVEIGSEIEFLSKHSYKISSPVAEFLREFSGLCIDCRTGSRLTIAPITALERLSRRSPNLLDDMNAYSDATPIAVIDPSAIVVLIRDDGRVLGVMPEVPDWSIDFGPTANTGLHNIVCRDPMST